MTPKQRAELKISETRQRLNELINMEDRSDEQTAELDTLTKSMPTLETEYRACIAAEPGNIDLPTGDGESRELRELADKADLATIMDNTIEQRSADGAERELQDHFKLNSNQVPLIKLRRAPETRAVTPAPANVGVNQDPIIPAVFPDSCHAFLGIDTPTVPVGEKSYPYLETSATVRTPAENASAAETTGSFVADIISSGRLQASFFYSREDGSRFAGLNDALTMNLNEALADGLDKEILAGTNGLFTGTNLSNNNVSAVTTFTDYISNFGYGRVDGKWASDTKALRIVMGAAAYAHCGATYRHNNADDIAIERLVEITGGVKVSAHVPAAASSKQNNVIRLGVRRDAIAPIWDGITLIPDEITLADEGQIKITAIMLYAVKILRTDGFHKQQVQVA